MPDREEIEKGGQRRELISLIYMGGAIFLFLALSTYHPQDPALVQAPLGPTKNLMGPVGASIADFLVMLLGKGAWFLPILFVLLGLSQYSLSKRLFPSVTHLTTGWGLSLLGLCIILSIFDKTGQIRTGGIIGYYTKGFVEEWFGIGGVWLGSITLIISGVLLGTTLELAMLWKRPREKTGGEENVSSPQVLINKQQKQIVQDEPELPVTLPRIIEPQKGKREKEVKKEGHNEDFNVSHAVQGQYTIPTVGLLNDPPPRAKVVDEQQYYENARTLEKKLLDFGVAGKVVEICPGPVVTMYEFSPAPGVKINKVASLQDDIALALRSHSVRIVAPIPGKAVIGIELANAKREIVHIKEILDTSLFRKQAWRLPLALGKDIVGEPVITDLARMPHLLIAGATGTGKSVGLNSMICSLLFRHVPNDLRLLMIDPKRIELSQYDGIPHLLHPVVSQPKEATRALRWTVMEMERRYQLLEEAGARNIDTYNAWIEKSDTDDEPERLPYLVVIIDELADLMMISSKEVEAAIARLAQMARAAGIHLIIATQRPSVDVLTGLIKANFPARISFKVSSKVDSRTILDAAGAERLLGMGDMLFLPPGSSTLERIHGAYCSEKEIKALTDFWRKQGTPDYDPSVTEVQEEEDSDANGSRGEFKDKLYDEAIEIVTSSGNVSISMIQRRLRIGYNRAARMVEQMEHDGIVTPADSMGRRQVLVRGYGE